MGSRQIVWRSILKATSSFVSPITGATPMASSAPSSSPLVEGVFAIHKPTAISSAQVIRDVQAHFTPSKLFSPWIERENARRNTESHNQNQKRRSWKQRQPIQVKMGHGGTLDPLATGVLILGVGSGTKVLSRFLECTKSYEAVLIFGAATDTYDSEGKIVAHQPYEHITREKVEEALAQFRGKIMQKPPIFSALSVQGKRLYEYAREGKVPPVEIKERPVETVELEMLEWMEGGEHEWGWPEREAEAAEKQAAGQVMGLKDHDATTPSSNKREREDESKGENGATEGARSPKRTKPEPESAPAEISTETPAAPADTTAPDANTGDKGGLDSTAKAQSIDAQQHTATSETPKEPRPRCAAPAVRIRMTVTSGFYVRSLCHDLGIAVGSAGHMANLVRTRQSDFDLAVGNVLSYDDLEGGEEKWGPKVKEMLESWEKNEGNKPQENEAKGNGGKQRPRNPKFQKQRLDKAPRRNSSSAEE